MSFSKSITVWKRKVAIYRAIGIGVEGGGEEKERIAQERRKKRIHLISNFRDVNPLTNYWSSLREGYKLEAHLISRLFHLSAKERTCTRAYVHECVRAYQEFAVPCLNLQCPFATRYVRQTRDSSVLTIASSRFCSAIFIKHACSSLRL